MASDADKKKWKENLARYQLANPGASANDYANSIQNGRVNAANALAQQQFEAGLGLSEESLGLAREQFSYSKSRDAEKTKNIRESMEQIKDVFAGRNPIYDSLKAESNQLNRERLEDLQSDAARELNFSLARAGNTGGSTEVDANKEMARMMGLGSGSAEIFAQSQSDALRAQDDALKGSLNNLAASGALNGDTVAGLAKGSTRGRTGTANYSPNINNTFQGLSSNIGQPRQQQQQQTGF